MTCIVVLHGGRPIYYNITCGGVFRDSQIVLRNLWQCQHFGNIWSCKASLRGCPHDLRGWFTKWVSIFSHAGYISWCSKRVVYLALTVTLSAIFQTPPAAPHFFASVHICIGYVRVCTSRNPEDKNFFPAQNGCWCLCRERMGVTVRSRFSAFPFYGGRPALPSPMQLNVSTTITQN